MSAVARCARRVPVAEDQILLAGRIAEGTARRRLGGGRRPRRLGRPDARRPHRLRRDRAGPGPAGVHGAQVCRTLAGGSARIMILTAAAGPLATL
jgi:hypothetical protein